MAMRKAYKHLTQRDRIKLEALSQLHLSKKEMAEQIGCHISTIYRELKRGEYERYGRDLQKITTYSSDIAQQKHDYNATAKGAPLKIGHDFLFSVRVEDLILHHDRSPAAALGEIRESGESFNTCICARTLYNYIHKGFLMNVTMKDLPRKGQSKQAHEKVRRYGAKKPLASSIEDRPEDINSRTTFGHWEMDTVVGKRQKGQVLLVLTERLTRREIIMKISGRTQEAVRKALDKLERKYGKYFKRIFQTITVDNGGEFLDAELLEKSCRTKGKRTKLYFCHPYSSWERGSNENANGMIRRKIPKGEKIERFSDSDISHVEDWINHYPRGIHNYQCAEKLFQNWLKELCDEWRVSN